MAFEYQYDATGRLQHRLFLESIQIPSDSTTAGVEREYLYNELGQLISEKTYDPYFGYSHGEVIRYTYYE